VAWQRGDLGSAYQSMQRYMEYSRELTGRLPDNDDYLLELSYAYSNLGSVALAQDRPAVALEGFRAGLVLAESLLAKRPGDYDRAFNVADTRSWIGTTLLELGRLAEGREEFAKAVAVMHPFHQGGQDKRASYSYCRLLILQADADINRGAVGEARRALEESLGVHRNLLANDSSNTTWLRNALTAETLLLSLAPPGQWTAREFAGLERIESKLAGSSSVDASDKDYLRLKFRVRYLRDVLLLRQGDAQAALRAAQQTQEEWRAASQGKAMVSDRRLTEAGIQQLLGSARAATGDVSGARETWQAAADRVDDTPTANLSLLAIRRLLAINIGDTARANEIGARLEAAGYRDPRADPGYTSRSLP
jgi:tetratricopeptide (TPR) repeat protein